MGQPETDDRVKYCPGGCHTQIADVVCCDACWARIPTSVPGQERWRTARKNAIAIRAWALCEDATEAAVAWLLTHPTRTGEHPDA